MLNIFLYRYFLKGTNVVEGQADTTVRKLNFLDDLRAGLIIAHKLEAMV